jgi:hypothetical protein
VEHVLAGAFARDVVSAGPGVLFATVMGQSEISPSAPYRIRYLQGRWQAEKISGWKAGLHATRDGSGNVLFACPGGWCEVAERTIAEWTPGTAVTPVFHKSDL